ncbi:hypothetical protein, partial [Acinetobacter pittii]|uniref:hypothetical protein n=1 Tax=Acinetobacter pittii TaxID=48296 RepID=UPI00325FEE7E
TSYPSCNLNFSNLGKLYLQRLYATKPIQYENYLSKPLSLVVFLSLIIRINEFKMLVIQGVVVILSI